MQQTPVWLGLGSNLGDKLDFLQRAIDRLQQDPRLNLMAVSSVYETEPLGFKSNDQFLNATAAVTWTGNPTELLGLLQEVEQALGRTRISGIRYSSRTIDLDILLFGQEVINNPDLRIPHPAMHERLFVLEPLKELIPSYIHPVLNRSITELVEICTDRSTIFIHAKPLSVNH